jgi:hypothetical protein
MLSANVSYKPMELAYTLNRCSHKYKLITDAGRLVVTVGGM